MRIRRTVIAPVILTLATVGSLIAAPAMAVQTSVSPAAARMAAVRDAVIYHA